MVDTIILKKKKKKKVTFINIMLLLSNIHSEKYHILFWLRTIKK